jgi:predicted amidophosphoribosyltransferase
VDVRAIIEAVFPAQCAGCNALGAGLCARCAPANENVAVYLPMLRVNGVGTYERGLRAAILALKDGRRDVAESLGRLAAPLVPAGSLLVPVPTTAKRRRIRGLDGVALVARSAAAIAGAQVAIALEQSSGDAQRGRSRAQRLAAQGRFTSLEGIVAGRRLTLFDDVCTTGATLRDCAAALREAGGVVDDAIVLAVANGSAPWSRPSPN